MQDDRELVELFDIENIPVEDIVPERDVVGERVALTVVENVTVAHDDDDELILPDCDGVKVAESEPVNEGVPEVESEVVAVVDIE